MTHFSQRLGVAFVAVCAFCAPAFAHATLVVQHADIGKSFKAELRVPHGCDGEATHTVRVTVPEGFFNVKPQPIAGWTLKTVRAPYAKTYMNHGREVSEGVTEIIWSGGNLANDWFEEFAFRGTFDADLAPGAFYFPAVQECDNGVAEWINTSGDADAGASAPKVMLASGEDAHAGHDMSGDKDMTMAEMVMVGDLELSGAFTRAMPPAAKAGGGFLNITNKGVEDDVLVSATSPNAPVVQLHEMKVENDVMKMREKEDGIAIPAGETVELAPGGLHIMFMQVEIPFVEGEMVAVTLQFEKAGSVEVMLPVGGLGDRTANPHVGH